MNITDSKLKLGKHKQCKSSKATK